MSDAAKLGFLGDDKPIKPAETTDTIPATPGAEWDSNIRKKEPFQKTDSHFKATTKEGPLNTALELEKAKRYTTLLKLEKDSLEEQVEQLQHKVQATQLFGQALKEFTGLTVQEQKKIADWFKTIHASIRVILAKKTLDNKQRSSARTLKALETEIQYWQSLKNLGVKGKTELLNTFRPTHDPAQLWKRDSGTIPQFIGASPKLKSAYINDQGVATFGDAQFGPGAVKEAQNFTKTVPGSTVLNQPFAQAQESRHLVEEIQTCYQNSESINWDVQKLRKNVSSLKDQINGLVKDTAAISKGLNAKLCQSIGILVDLRPEIFTRQGDLLSKLQSSIKGNTQLGDTEPSEQLAQSVIQAKEALNLIQNKQAELTDVKNEIAPKTFLTKKTVLMLLGSVGAIYLAKKYWDSRGE